MALSGSVSTNTGMDGRYYKLSWTATQSIANNTSTITWVLDAVGAGSRWEAERTVYVNIDGASVYSKTTYVERYAGRVASGTKVITHNGDGTKTFSVSLGAAVYYSNVTCTGSSTFTLNTIARASTLSASNGTLGEAQTLTADRKSSSFTHTLTWTCGAYSGTIASKSSSTSWNFTPEIKLAEGAPNGTQVYCTFTLTTFNGSTTVGSSSKSVWLTIPESVVPTISSVSVSDGKGYLATYGSYIQGQSTLQVTISASGSYGSTIGSYSVPINGTTYSSSQFTTDGVRDSGSVNVKATVKDSRGRTASKTTTVTVIPYSVPKITALKVQRCNADGTVNDLGGYTKITFAYSVTGLSGKNSKSAILRYKQSSASAWYEQSIDLTAYEATVEKVVAMDEGHSYDVMVTITDAFTLATRSTSVSTGYCLYHIPNSGKGITFGGIAESDGFNIKMPAHFTGANTFGGAAESSGFNVKQNAHFYNGLTEDIQVLTSGNCNTVTTSGNYYIAGGLTNRPLDQNGWLTVKAYSNALYCYQEYMSYSGVKYHRMRENGTWKSWVLDTPADTVVDSGSSGIWTWRKWNSGISECWGINTDTGVSITKAWGSVYESERKGGVTLPSGLFTATPVCTFQVISTPNGAVLSLEIIGGDGGTDRTPYWAYTRPNNTITSAAIKVAIHAIGTWK